MPKATPVFDADDSRLRAVLTRINDRMLAPRSRIAKFAAAGVVTAEVRSVAAPATIQSAYRSFARSALRYYAFKQALDVHRALKDLRW